MKISLLPEDVGFNLKVTDHTVVLSFPELTVSYLDADDQKAAVSGSLGTVGATLRLAGYRVLLNREDAVINQAREDAATFVAEFGHPTVTGWDSAAWARISHEFEGLWPEYREALVAEAKRLCQINT